MVRLHPVVARAPCHTLCGSQSVRSIELVLGAHGGFWFLCRLEPESFYVAQLRISHDDSGLTYSFPGCF